MKRKPGKRADDRAAKCLHCGETTEGRVLTSDCELLRCEGCGLVFAAGWSAQFVSELYTYYEDRLTWPEEEIFLSLTEESLDSIVGRLEQEVSGRQLLDVGCGQGDLLRVAAKRGWAARGIDLSASAIAVCKRFGLNGAAVDVFAKELDRERFDAVAMIELLEHVPRPAELLARAGDLLSPGGVIFVTTPNFDSIGRRVLGTSWPLIRAEHISYFTPKTLRMVAESANLGCRRIDTKNVSLATFKFLTGITPRVTPATPGQLGGHEGAETQALRVAFATSTTRRTVKAGVNRVLRMTGLGEKIVAVFERV